MSHKLRAWWNRWRTKRRLLGQLQGINDIIAEKLRCRNEWLAADRHGPGERDKAMYFKGRFEALKWLSGDE